MPAKIPQDIEREDRIVGPLTLKQLLWILGGGAIMTGIVRYWMAGYLYTTEAILLSAFFGLLTFLFAFFKINDLNFVGLLVALVRFLLLPKQAVWQRTVGPGPQDSLLVPELKKGAMKAEKNPEELRSELEKLSFILDTGAPSSEMSERIAALPGQPAETIEAVEELEDVLAQAE